MKHEIQCQWLDNMAFEAEIGGHKLILDADVSVGGNDQGPRPKPLLLTALAGCSGMDVIAILAKMKVVPEAFSMTVEGELTEEHPRHYRSINIIYRFKGHDLPVDKLEKAVQLSQEKYCGVSAQLKMGVPLTHSIEVIS